jgi:hypothetical protein
MAVSADVGVGGGSKGSPKSPVFLAYSCFVSVPGKARKKMPLIEVQIHTEFSYSVQLVQQCTYI